MSFKVGDILNGVSTRDLDAGTIFKVLTDIHKDKLVIKTEGNSNVFLNNGILWTNLDYTPDIEIIKLPG